MRDKYHGHICASFSFYPVSSVTAPFFACGQHLIYGFSSDFCNTLFGCWQRCTIQTTYHPNRGYEKVSPRQLEIRSDHFSAGGVRRQMMRWDGGAETWNLAFVFAFFFFFALELVCCVVPFPRKSCWGSQSVSSNGTMISMMNGEIISRLYSQALK